MTWFLLRKIEITILYLIYRIYNIVLNLSTVFLRIHTQILMNYLKKCGCEPEFLLKYQNSLTYGDSSFYLKKKIR